MHTFRRATAVGLLIVASFRIDLVSQDVDPVVGTWELNVAKSKYSPGPPPKSETRTYAVAGQDIKATLKGTDREGKPYTGEWTMNYDGKDRPMKGNPDADTLSLKRTDASTAEFTLKRAGKVVITGTRTISKDGKTMTITAKGTNTQGQTLNEVEVFEKR